MRIVHHRRSHSTCCAMIMLIIAAWAMTGCAAPAVSGVTPTIAPTNVSLQLAWVHEYSVSGFYAAEKHGHYAAQNLAVQFDTGGFGAQGYIEPVQQVTDGVSDFGITGAAGLIQARARGLPVVAVATILQRSPMAVLSLASSGINRPEDLVGRRVAVNEGAATQILKTMLTSLGIDLATVEIVPRTSYGIEPLTSGEVDALVGWVINEGVLLREANIETSAIIMSDYGVDTYEMVLFTTEKMIAERPDVVRRFVRATLQGWQDAVDNPDQAASLVLGYDPALQLDGQQRRLQAMLPLIKPAGSTVGRMQPDIWELTQQMLIEHQQLDTPINLEQVYTMQFLESNE